MSQRHKGITAFLVNAESPGLRVGPPLQKLGIKASSTCPVYLDDVEVPDSCVLGEVGEGYKLAISLLNEGRIGGRRSVYAVAFLWSLLVGAGIAAQMLGLAKGAFDAALKYVHERKQFGQRIIDFQGVRFQCAEMASEIESAHLLTYNAALLVEGGRSFKKEAAIAKLVTSRVAQKISSASVDLLGGNGFTQDYGVEKLYRDSKIGSIYEGTSNILLETISKDLQREYSSLVI
ncbi:UNVERIFIED_CONTAM: hypothetical protein H355_007672 [Colinus virginianus]|nr:hypothetical protein H355_007672 [Colinus virginianus]